jgi:putative transposase
MKQLYGLAGITKQAHLAAVQRRAGQADRFLLLGAVLKTERAKHPAMSLKKLYVKLRPDFAGRDAFIGFGMANGFEPVIKARFHKTTHSGETGAYPNLLHDLIVYDINRLWVGDITYFKIGDTWFYIVLIEDVYSRKILGWHASDRMFAQANLKAFQMAVRERGVDRFKNLLIHHSDKGSQYRSFEYTDKVKEHELLISMGNCCYDNAFMESTNGILKNEYLKHRPIHNGEDLLKYLKQDVHLYNNERPHGSLNMMTPHEFECYISNIPLEQRGGLPIYTDKSKQNNLLIMKPDNQQLRFQFPGFR